MQTLEIRDGQVINNVVINSAHRAAYEMSTGNRLVDADDMLQIMNGDTYDEETKTFWRDGQRVEALMALPIREHLLQSSDYTQVLDYPCTDAERDAWRAYRQALRDLPEQPGWPDDINWPTPPVHEKAEGSMQNVIDTILGGVQDGE